MAGGDGKSENHGLSSLRHGASAGQDSPSVLSPATTISPRASASSRASAAAAAAAAGDDGAGPEGPREPAPPARERGPLPRHPALQRMRGAQDDVLVTWGVRMFSAISVVNTLAIGALLFSRAVSRAPPCVPAVQPLRGAQHLPGQPLLQREEAQEPERDQERAPQPRQRLHLSPGFLRQLERVTQRKILRRNVTGGRRLHAINDAIIPIVPCPQKVRVHGPSGHPSFWLCMPQHLFGRQWPVGYSLTNKPDYSYEAELYRRYGIQSTVFDRTLPLGRDASPQYPFVATVGGAEAEPMLHKMLLQSGARQEPDPAAQLYNAASVLRSTCYACESYILVPTFGHSKLASQTTPPAVGQIVVHLERWRSPWDASTRHFLRVMEKAGYYAFHAEQIFGSYRNLSYSISLIHQAILFPHLLGKENQWLDPQIQTVSR